MLTGWVDLLLSLVTRGRGTVTVFFAVAGFVV
jgi:hypothetical protein